MIFLKMKNNSYIEEYFKDIKFKKYYDENNKDALNNINDYIKFIKGKITLNKTELKYIIYLTLTNRYATKLCKENNEKLFIDIFMHNYNININKINKIHNIKKLDFNSLINKINSNKKRTYILFENINNINIFFYLELYKEYFN